MNQPCPHIKAKGKPDFIPLYSHINRRRGGLQAENIVILKKIK
jgi:hypothetical protein